MTDTLKLASEVDEVAEVYPDMAEVSAELRRLHAINAELKKAFIDLDLLGGLGFTAHGIIDKALEKAKQ